MQLGRLTILASACALSACATNDAATRAEVVSLRQQLEAMRARSEALEERVEKLEDRDVLLSAARAAPEIPAPAASQAKPDPLAVPPLTVVRLKPKLSPAPPLDLQTPVVEPTPEEVRALSAAPAGDSDALLAKRQAEFDRALEALRTGDVTGGTEALLDFAQANPEDPKADNALYFAGLGYMGLHDYEDASNAFSKVLSSYPAGDAVADAMLKLAECRVHLHQRTAARALYASVVSRYPGTAAAEQASQRLTSLSP